MTIFTQSLWQNNLFLRIMLYVIGCFVVVGILHFTIAIASAHNTTNITTWKTYRNTYVNYTIKYPNNWVINDVIGNNKSPFISSVVYFNDTYPADYKHNIISLTVKREAIATIVKFMNTSDDEGVSQASFVSATLHGKKIEKGIVTQAFGKSDEKDDDMSPDEKAKEDQDILKNDGKQSYQLLLPIRDQTMELSGEVGEKSLIELMASTLTVGY